MDRRIERLRLIAASGLPFAVPEPPTPVTMFNERAAVAVSWIAGDGLALSEGDPSGFSRLCGWFPLLRNHVRFSTHRTTTPAGRSGWSS